MISIHMAVLFMADAGVCLSIVGKNVKTCSK